MSDQSKNDTLESRLTAANAAVADIEQRQRKARATLEAAQTQWRRVIGAAEMTGTRDEEAIAEARIACDEARALVEFFDGEESPMKVARERQASIKTEIEARDEAKRWADRVALGKKRDNLYHGLVAILQTFNARALEYIELSDAIGQESPIPQLRNISRAHLAGRQVAGRLAGLLHALTFNVRKAAAPSVSEADRITTAYAHLVKQELEFTALFTTRPGSEPTAQTFDAEKPDETPANVVEPEARVEATVTWRDAMPTPRERMMNSGIGRARAQGVPED